MTLPEWQQMVEEAMAVIGKQQPEVFLRALLLGLVKYPDAWSAIQDADDDYSALVRPADMQKIEQSRRAAKAAAAFLATVVREHRNSE